MTTPDTPPAPQTPRMPETPPHPTPPPPSQIADALTRAQKTHDPRAIAEYLTLRRRK